MTRILVVDDDLDVRTALTQLLESSGYTVLQAEDGRAAISLLRSTTPDVVLTDIIMPEEDGLGVLMMLAKEFPRIPVVAMSGTLGHSVLYLNVAKKLGARHVLTKPFSVDHLLGVLKDVLNPLR